MTEDIRNYAPFGRHRSHKAGESSVYHHDITRRDWLAGLAMQGIISNPKICEEIDLLFEGDTAIDATQDTVMAARAYMLADAVIAEGAK